MLAIAALTAAHSCFQPKHNGFSVRMSIAAKLWVIARVLTTVDSYKAQPTGWMHGISSPMLCSTSLLCISVAQQAIWHSSTYSSRSYNRAKQPKSGSP